MLERVRRMMAAEVKYPSVKAGNRRCCGPPRPPAGKMPKMTPNRRMSISPSQNGGSDWPSTAKIRAPMSRTPPRRTAEYTPMGTPIATLKNMATTPNSTVAGRRSQICSVTGLRVRTDVPKSPWTIFFTYRPYCTIRGLSRPRWRVSRSKSRWVALTSSNRYTGFPDRRVKTKTMLMTTSMLSKACSTRPTTYPTMLLPPPREEDVSFWLQTDLFERRRPGIGVDEHQRRLLHPRSDPTRPNVLVQGPEAHALVQKLLDFVQEGGALAVVEFDCLLFVQRVDVRIAPIGVCAVAGHDFRHAWGS